MSALTRHVLVNALFNVEYYVQNVQKYRNLKLSKDFDMFGVQSLDPKLWTLEDLVRDPLVQCRKIPLMLPDDFCILRNIAVCCCKHGNKQVNQHNDGKKHI